MINSRAIVNILFVCTGNVCRSPMAEGFLRHEAERRGLDLGVRSTGTHAWHGRTATIDGRRTMQELGVPIEGHMTLPLEQSLVDWADLIIGLSTEHVRDTVREHPEAADRTLTLKELIRVLPALEAPDVSAMLAAHRSSEPLGDADVDDPWGERQAAYRRVAAEIQDLITQMADGLERVGAGARA